MISIAHKLPRGALLKRTMSRHEISIRTPQIRIQAPPRRAVRDGICHSLSIIVTAGWDGLDPPDLLLGIPGLVLLAGYNAPFLVQRGIGGVGVVDVDDCGGLPVADDI